MKKDYKVKIVCRNCGKASCVKASKAIYKESELSSYFAHLAKRFGKIQLSDYIIYLPCPNCGEEVFWKEERITNEDLGLDIYKPYGSNTKGNIKVRVYKV